MALLTTFIIGQAVTDKSKRKFTLIEKCFRCFQTYRLHAALSNHTLEHLLVYWIQLYQHFDFGNLVLQCVLCITIRLSWATTLPYVFWICATKVCFSKMHVKIQLHCIVNDLIHEIFHATKGYFSCGEGPKSNNIWSLLFFARQQTSCRWSRIYYLFHAHYYMAYCFRILEGFGIIKNIN